MNGYYRCDTDEKGQRCRQPAKMRMTKGRNYWDLCGDHYAQGGWVGWVAIPIEKATVLEEVIAGCGGPRV